MNSVMWDSVLKFFFLVEFRTCKFHEQCMDQSSETQIAKTPLLPLFKLTLNSILKC